MQSPLVVSSQSVQQSEIRNPSYQEHAALVQDRCEQTFNGQSYASPQPGGLPQTGLEQYHAAQHNYPVYPNALSIPLGAYNGQQIYPFQQGWQNQQNYPIQPAYPPSQTTGTPHSTANEQQYCGPPGFPQPYTPTSPMIQGPPVSGTVECPPYPEYSGSAQQGSMPTLFPPPPVWAMAHTQQGPMFYWLGSTPPQPREAETNTNDVAAPTTPPKEDDTCQAPPSASK